MQIDIKRYIPVYGHEEGNIPGVIMGSKVYLSVEELFKSEPNAIDALELGGCYFANTQNCGAV